MWSDEFNYSGEPDPTKWSFDIGDGCPKLCGWGNNELQYYTDSPHNAQVENGSLVIRVNEEKMGTREFTSAKLTTRGLHQWKYGRFEIRAKLPGAKGTWAAIWMMPTTKHYGPWPKCGEIDIMEHVGFDPDTVEASAHTGSYYFTNNTQKHARIFVERPQDEFHVYTLDWYEDHYDVFVDDELYFTFNNEETGFMEWPFDQPFYLILNVAYGGNWGIKQGLDRGSLPQRMEVDYVRVYQ